MRIRQNILRSVWLAILLALVCAIQACTTDTGMGFRRPHPGAEAGESPSGDGPGKPARFVESTGPPKAIGVYLQAAQQFEDLGDVKNAMINYWKVLELDPDHPNAQYGFAKMLAQEGAREQAIDTLRHLLTKLAQADGSTDTRKVKRQAQSLLAELDEVGLALADAAVHLSEKGLAAEKAGRPANALEIYRRAVKLWPPSETARERAVALCSKQEWALPPEFSGLKGGVAYLELWELIPESSSVKNGELLRDQTKWGLPIYNQGRVFANALWAPAPSEVTYRLNGKFTRFTAKILVSAFKGARERVQLLETELGRTGAGTVRFSVTGDDEALYESKTLTYADGAQEITVNVEGVKTLVLKTSEADGSDLLDFSVWADGRLYMGRPTDQGKRRDSD